MASSHSALLGVNRLKRFKFAVNGSRHVSALEEEVRTRFANLESANHILDTRVLAMEGELVRLEQASTSTLARVEEVTLARVEEVCRRISEVGDLAEATRAAVADLLTEVAEVIAEELNNPKSL